MSTSVYLNQLMRGNSTIRGIVEAHLRSAMPPLIDVARIQWGLDEKTLPYPKDYSSSDPSEALEYPFCGSYCTGADQFVRADITPSISASYNAEYEVAIFVATSTALLGTDSSGIKVYEEPGRESALRQRDDLMAIMRASILNEPSLGTADSADENNRARISEESLRETYPEPVKTSDRNPVWVCSGVINVNINLAETTVHPIIGLVEETNAGMYKLSFVVD